MTTIQRYGIDYVGGAVVAVPDGPYVLWLDAERLQQTNEALEAEVRRLREGLAQIATFSQSKQTADLAESILNRTPKG